MFLVVNFLDLNTHIDNGRHACMKSQVWFIKGNADEAEPSVRCQSIWSSSCRWNSRPRTARAHPPWAVQHVVAKKSTTPAPAASPLLPEPVHYHKVCFNSNQTAANSFLINSGCHNASLMQVRGKTAPPHHSLSFLPNLKPSYALDCRQFDP